MTWAKGKSAALPVRLRIFCMDEKGILANMTLAITNAEANIVSAQIKSTVDKRGENIFELVATDTAKNTTKKSVTVHSKRSAANEAPSAAIMKSRWVKRSSSSLMRACNTIGSVMVSASTLRFIS